MNNWAAFGISILAFLISSCTKEKPDGLATAKGDRGEVRIYIESPINGASIPRNQDTVVQVFLWDELSLHEFTVEITDAEGKRYFYQEGHTHFPEYRFTWPWKNTAPKGTELYLKVQASNHLNILSTQTIQFQTTN